MNEIALVIMVMCKLNTPGIEMPKAEKISCIEFMTNCLVGENGAFLKKEVDICEHKWKNYKKNNGGKND